MSVFSDPNLAEFEQAEQWWAGVVTIAAGVGGLLVLALFVIGLVLHGRRARGHGDDPFERPVPDGVRWQRTAVDDPTDDVHLTGPVVLG